MVLTAALKSVSIPLITELIALEIVFQTDVVVFYRIPGAGKYTLESAQGRGKSAGQGAQEGPKKARIVFNTDCAVDEMVFQAAESADSSVERAVLNPATSLTTRSRRTRRWRSTLLTLLNLPRTTPLSAQTGLPKRSGLKLRLLRPTSWKRTRQLHSRRMPLRKLRQTRQQTKRSGLWKHRSVNRKPRHNDHVEKKDELC